MCVLWMYEQYKLPYSPPIHIQWTRHQHPYMYSGQGTTNHTHTKWISHSHPYTYSRDDLTPTHKYKMCKATPPLHTQWTRHSHTPKCLPNHSSYLVTSSLINVPHYFYQTTMIIFYVLFLKKNCQVNIFSTTKKYWFDISASVWNFIF